MQRLFNEKEDKQNLRNNERKLNGQKNEENMSIIGNNHTQEVRKIDNQKHIDDLKHIENMDK